MNLLQTKTISRKRYVIVAACLCISTSLAWSATNSRDDNHMYPNSGASVTQQKQTIKVTVTDSQGAIIGANVMVKGSTIGNITDINGIAIIENVPLKGTLVISYIGYKTQEFPLTGKKNLSVRLLEDTQNLEEVVVTGYGSQAKKDITGSVSVVSAKDISETPVATFAEALQGKASGVYVSTTGAPGSDVTIRIRGVGSVNGSDPLIVIDGISNAAINSVNPNDIESMQVLKDASATAIYGAQGANGVIIITTKKGTKSGQPRISYDGYVGVAKMANSGYDLLNGWEAMEFQAYGLVNRRDYRGETTGLSDTQFGSLNANDELTMPYAIKPAGLSKEDVISRWGSIDNWVKSYKSDGSSSWSRSAYYQMLEDGASESEARKGTDWYNEIVRTGLVQNHQISALGGSDKGTYSLGIGYMNREGTIKSSYFDRYSLRANGTFIPNKYFNLGSDINLSVMETSGERGTQGDDNIFAQTYTIQPWVPIYNVGGEFAGSQAPNGGRANSAVATVERAKNDWNRMFRGQGAVFAELKPITGLSIKTQFSAMLRGNWQRTFNERDIMTNKEGASTNNLYEYSSYNLNWQWTNTATYDHTFAKDHKMTVILGTEALNENLGREMSATRYNYAFEEEPNTWTINNGAAANLNNSGTAFNHTSMFGMFFRGDYSYKGKYLATATVRRDASSKFAKDNRWGTFPSLSIGWRISDEKFMKPTNKWLDDLKIRAGYGTTGNSNIGAYNYAFQFSTGNSYLYSTAGTDSEVAAGYAISSLGDTNAKWETTKMTNVGFDASLFNKLTFSADFYVKKTSDMLVPANWSALAGNATKPNVNIGDMKNTGFDLSATWRDKIGKVHYTISGNVSHYKNDVVKLGSSDLFYSTRLSKVTITTEGQPVGMFYGYKIDGIYKSEEDVLNYKNDKGQTVLPYAIASESDLNAKNYIGRYKIKDINNDGKIGAEDRTIIGNPHPDLTGGMNLGINYNNWDMSANFYFSIGNDLYRHYMYYTHYAALQSNYSKDRRDNSWDPVKNPNGIYPLYCGSTGEGTEAANESNSMYIQDGSYLRLQTLALGYSLPKKLIEKVKLSKLRVYVQMMNVFTITGYDGLDPEVRNYNNATRSMGIDYGSYGMPRLFLVGLNLTL